MSPTIKGIFFYFPLSIFFPFIFIKIEDAKEYISDSPFKDGNQECAFSDSSSLQWVLQCRDRMGRRIERQSVGKRSRGG